MNDETQTKPIHALVPAILLTAFHGLDSAGDVSSVDFAGTESELTGVSPFPSWLE